VALIGDAAGYNGPITGQGLSLELRDVRVLAELLLAENDWSAARLLPYAEERRARFVAELFAQIRTTLGALGADRRRRFFERLREPDGPVRQVLAAVHLGPERLPEWALNATPVRIVEDLANRWQPSLAPTTV
jgi:2-polyprenyl-6-methoxyphenol hydroxylase-like FAD-dependent oxidoreductase